MHAGVPYTIPVSFPLLNQVLYATHGMTLHRVKYLGKDGRFDRYDIHKFEWLSGPRKGKIDRSYSQSFWRTPTKRERRDVIWPNLTEYEQQKLIAGRYKGLKAQMFQEAL